MSPTACITVAVIGTLTALFAATIGLKQWDIKKVLAYSTISQLGYMFMGVGAGAYAAGMFHLVTHAFFKALLFLGAGSVIFAMHRAYHHTGSHDDAQDMRNMGGLRKYMPWTFVHDVDRDARHRGRAAVLGILLEGRDPGRGVRARAARRRWPRRRGSACPEARCSTLCTGSGLLTAFLTAIYMTRMMLYTFHGPNRTGEAERAHLREAPWSMTGPLVVLGVLSAVGGWLNLPARAAARAGRRAGEVARARRRRVDGYACRRTRGGDGHEHRVRAHRRRGGHRGARHRLRGGAPQARGARAQARRRAGARLRAACSREKYYVDELYDDAIVTPIVSGSRNVLWTGIDRGIIDSLFVNGSAVLARGVGWIGSQLQSGQTGAYAWAIAIGALAVLGAFTFR